MKENAKITLENYLVSAENYKQRLLQLIAKIKDYNGTPNTCIR